ncbi:reverse transcriptase N-terminal domain-containing protein [Enterobacter hormaechei]
MTDRCETSDQQWCWVRSLQCMLVHSFSAKALAVKRVTENAGRRRANPSVAG